MCAIILMIYSNKNSYEEIIKIMDSKITVYHADYLVNDGLLTAWKQTIKDISRNRWLIWVNFKKDFFSQYKQSGLGMFWSLIMPIVPVSAYLFLAYIRVLNVKGNIPFPVYIIIGMTFWLFLKEGINSGMKAIQKDKGILTKIDTPLIVVTLARYGNVCANTLIRLAFLIFVLFIYRIVPKPNILLIPFVFLPLICLGLGLGIMLGVFNVANTDIENITNVFLTYGMFVSSVIFPMPVVGIMAKVNNINFFNHLIVGIRDFIVTGHIQYSIHFWAASAVSVGIFLLAVKWQHSLQYKVKRLL